MCAFGLYSVGVQHFPCFSCGVPWGGGWGWEARLVYVLYLDMRLCVCVCVYVRIGAL